MHARPGSGGPLDGVTRSAQRDAWYCFHAERPSEQRRRSATDDHVISIGGRYFAVDREEANRLEEAGVPFAYVHDYPMPDGTYRTVTVPVN